MSRAARRLRKRLESLVAIMAVRICGQDLLQKTAFAHHEYPRIRKALGEFNLDRDYSKLHIRGLSKESGSIRGVIVGNVRKAGRSATRVLLPGEYNADKASYAELFGVPRSAIVTAGIGQDVDHQWNFEGAPPEMGTFDFIVSQAMLEHLLDPYKHVVDLCRMLEPEGHLILHSHIPGFGYHRHPVDCLRFFPDWFEEVAKRQRLAVLDRHVGELRICYTLRKA